MAARKHLIKKYANRKLYDTHTSRYITLEGISQLVRDGHDIQVVERDTGRDLTPLVLSQIVMGEEKRGHDDGEDVVSETLQERGQALFDYVRRTLSGSAAIVSSRVGRGRTELEDLIDLAVEQALTRLNIPTRRDLDAIAARLDAIEARANGGTTRPAGTTPRTRRRGDAGAPKPARPSRAR